MNKFFSAVVLGLSMFVSFTAQAADRASADQAIAMTRKAVAYLKANGSGKAFADFANPANTDFHDRDLYIYVYDMKGNCVAHGANPKLIGKNLRDMRDGEGKYIVRGFIEAASSAAGSGWVDYTWPNPVTKAIETKSGYVERSGDLIVGSGIYK